MSEEVTENEAAAPTENGVGETTLNGADPVASGEPPTDITSSEQQEKTADETAQPAVGDSEATEDSKQSNVVSETTETPIETVPKETSPEVKPKEDSPEVKPEDSPVSETKTSEESTEPKSEELSVEVQQTEDSRPEVKEIESPEIKEKLNSIIREIDETVDKEDITKDETDTLQQDAPGSSKDSEKPAKEDEKPEMVEETQVGDDGEVYHTWRPKGKYDLVKTEIKHEDVVAISVDDVKEPPPLPQEELPQAPDGGESGEAVGQDLPGPITVPQLLPNGELGSPIEIPEGIPLLARVLPKEEDSNKEKIPLERLFTPATDSGEITPRKKKAFASSDFYAADHPTIDDQLQLAQKISCSLIDQDNKTSKGQAMYEKRKQRSEKWIHTDGGKLIQAQSEFSESAFQAFGVETAAPQPIQPKNKPAMKLVMNPKGVQDHTTVEQHYQELMEQSSSVGGAGVSLNLAPGAVHVPASPEIAKDIINDMQSPTGKGAALFAKRKKRMDKFIVDETNVQKTSAYQQEQQSFVTNNTNTQNFNQVTSNTQQQSFSSVTSSSVQSSKKKTVQQRDQEQKQIMQSFLKNRESSIKLVKSPWDSVLETGNPGAAFQKNQQQQNLFSAAGAPAANMPSWLEMPKAVPVNAPMPKSQPSEPLPTPPSLFGAKEPIANDGEGGLVYTAQVKVQQTSSLPGTPVDPPVAPSPFTQAPAPAAPATKPVAVPKPAAQAAKSGPAPFMPKAGVSYVPKSAAAEAALRAEMEERRKSANFNLAASGWGTYNNYYRPTSFASS